MKNGGTCDPGDLPWKANLNLIVAITCTVCTVLASLSQCAAVMRVLAMNVN